MDQHQSRKPIFKRLTFPRESATLVGLSFYDIFIKPLLKIFTKCKSQKDIEMTNFTLSAVSKIIKLWPTIENHLLLNTRTLMQEIIMKGTT